jgi:hypothetical protein
MDDDEDEARASQTPSWPKFPRAPLLSWLLLCGFASPHLCANFHPIFSRSMTNRI